MNLFYNLWKIQKRCILLIQICNFKGSFISTGILEDFLLTLILTFYTQFSYTFETNSLKNLEHEQNSRNKLTPLYKKICI